MNFNEQPPLWWVFLNDMTFCKIQIISEKKNRIQFSMISSAILLGPHIFMVKKILISLNTLNHDFQVLDPWRSNADLWRGRPPWQCCQHHLPFQKVRMGRISWNWQQGNFIWKRKLYMKKESKNAGSAETENIILRSHAILLLVIVSMNR